MVDNNLKSRSKRHHKKQKNNRNLMILLALAFLFFTILLALVVLNKNAEPEVEQDELIKEQEVNETEKESDKTEKESDMIDNKDEKESDTTKDKDKEKKAVDKKEAEQNRDTTVSVTELDPEEIEDPNVLKAYVGGWSPIGTNQSDPHTTNYQNGSQDRIEIKKAVSAVTDVPEDSMVEWRVENGGDQKVIATVSDDNETEYYRVYLTWIDNQGWQVTKFENLKQNDKK